jgi:hypothetical protein
MVSTSKSSFSFVCLAVQQQLPMYVNQPTSSAAACVLCSSILPTTQQQGRPRQQAHTVIFTRRYSSRPDPRCSLLCCLCRGDSLSDRTSGAAAIQDLDLYCRAGEALRHVPPSAPVLPSSLGTFPPPSPRLSPRPFLPPSTLLTPFLPSTHSPHPFTWRRLGIATDCQARCSSR